MEEHMTSDGRTAGNATGRAEVATVGHRGLPLGVPFVLVHLACLGVVVVGWSPVALVACCVSYVVRGLGITAFYHRGLTHRAFETSRPVQLAGAVLAASAAQMGPLWWVGHHRVHHRHSDRAGDVHSPRDGMAWSHVLWVFSPHNATTRDAEVQDLARYPELRFLDRRPHLAPAVFAAATFAVGTFLDRVWPALGTDGWQMLVWGFFIPTTLLYHATFAVNSLGHRRGRRQFATADDSRNNWAVALVSLGEGWHNNHHRFPRSARHGLRRREVDVTYLVLRTMAAVGLVRNLRSPVADRAIDARRGGDATPVTVAPE
jgi:stearoyl-CoA desaturase (delta-9 desaturase)